MGIENPFNQPPQESGGNKSEEMRELLAKFTQQLESTLEEIKNMTPEQLQEAQKKSGVNDFMREKSLSMPHEVDPKTAFQAMLLTIEAVRKLRKEGVDINLEFKRLGEGEVPKIKKFE